MEGVEAGAQVATKEFRLGEAEIDLLTQRAPFNTGDDVLAPAAEVALGDAQVDDEGIDGAEAGADGKLAGRLFRDGDIDHRPVRRRTAGLFDGDVLEEAEGPQVVARPLQQGAVEGVAFGQHHFAADDVVQRAGVADHVDPVDVDPLAFLDVEGDVDGVGLGIGAIGRFNLDEGIACRTRGEGQGVDRRLDLVALVQIARTDRQQQLQEVGVQPVVLGDDINLAEIVAIAFVHRQGDAESAVVRSQLRDRRQDPEIVIAAVGVKFPQLLAVVVQAVRVVVVVGREQAVPGRLLRHHDLAQVAVRKRAVAEEGDGAHAGLGTLVDLEHHVDAVLVQLDDLRRHGRGDAA